MTMSVPERAPGATRSRSKVLLGFDAAHSGDDVVGFGCAFAQAIDAVPELVSVLSWPPAFLAGYPHLRQELEDELSDRFEEIRQQCEGTGIETRAVPGPSPAATLHELAEAEDVRAIVVGSAHRGVAGRVLAGSVGESLMYGAPKSVAIVPRGYAAAGSHSLRKIAVAFDASPEAHRALEAGVELARRLGGSLTVLAVASPPHLTYGAEWSPAVYDELERAARQEMQKLLDRALIRIPGDVEHHGRILEGVPARELAEASDDFDLLLAGSRAHGPIRRTVLGSTTRVLIRTAACPVLVLPRGAGIDPLGLRGARAGISAVGGAPDPVPEAA